MKKLSFLIILFNTLAAFSQNSTIANQQAEDFYNKAMPAIRPALKNIIQTNASQLKGRTVNADSLGRALKNNKQLSQLQSVDIDALVMLIMMQMSKDANQDMKNMLIEMKRVNDEKKQMREATQLMKQQQARMKDSLRKNYDARTGIQPAKSKDSLTKINLNMANATLQNRKDSLSDLSEEQQLRMQTYMDRKSKMETAISNIMKKIADTQNQIIQNLK